MNGKQLKNSILQWAIQGKLVPQDPNDEPASVLLDKIRQEKERLIKEKKIKRDKNASIIYRGEDNSYYEKMLATGEVKCIDEEIPFEVPKGWEWCRLVEVGKTETGTTPSKSHPEYFGDYIPFLGPANILNSKIVSVTQGLSDIGVDYGRIVPKNTILQVCIGGSIGKCAITDKPVTFNQQINSITPYLCNVEFVHIVLQSEYFRLTMMDKATGTATPIINRGNWETLLFPLPPINEQERIVANITELTHFLGIYSNKQEELNKLNSNMYQRLKKAILQEAIQGKLVPQIEEEGTAQELLEHVKAEKQKLVKEGKLKKSALNDSVIFRGDDNKYYEKIGKKCVDITEEIPFSIPANWQWVRIRDVFQLNPKNEADDETLAAFIPMEKISAGYKSNFTFDLVKWGNIKKGFTHFANGDVAFAKITPCFQNRKSAIFHGLPNGIGAGTTELKVLRPYGNTIGRWYLLYFLESPYFIDEATFKGTANQQRIVVGYLESKLFPLPPKEEQQRIVAQIEELFEQLH